tara:strand:- start:1674 stop:1928 length:255 start_codon:yes stop_codon:yes gene_type:complete
MTQAILAAHGYTTQIIEALFDFCRYANDARRERKAIKATEKALMALSTKDLDDIGICRGDIYSIARKQDVIDQCVTNKNLRGWV